MGLGCSEDAGAAMNVYTAEQVHALAEQALHEDRDVDLLPQALSRKVDFLIQETITQAEGLAEARMQVRAAEMPVSQLQLLMERRSETMRQLNAVAGELVAFLRADGRVADINAQFGRFLAEHGLAEPRDDGAAAPEDPDAEPLNSTTVHLAASPQSINALAFAQLAFEQALDKARQFDEILAGVAGFYRETQRCLAAENVERFESDCSGFLEVLEKLDYVLQHCRQLHVQIAQRDFCVVKLQKIIEQLQGDAQRRELDVVGLVATRNGLLKAYYDLRKQMDLQVAANTTLRANATNCVQLAIDHAANTDDHQLASQLVLEASDYSRAVRRLSEVVREEVIIMQDVLDQQLQCVSAAVGDYKDVVYNRKQVSTQTYRLRKMYDEAVQVEDLEAADAKDAKKGAKGARK